MIRTTPAGALTATSYPMTYEIIEKLSRAYCPENMPVLNISWSVAEQRTIGTTVYGTVQAVISVAFPQGGCQRVYTEEFEVSGEGTAISVEGVAGYTEAAYTSQNGCKACGVKAVGTLTVTLTPDA